MSEATILFVLIIIWDLFRDFILINYSHKIKKVVKKFKNGKG